MAKKITGSNKYELNSVDMVKLGTGALVALGGAFLTYVVQVSTQVDFGDYTPIAVAVLSVAVNLGRKFLADYSR